ncbi:MAG: SIR2 family protein [Nitrospira sp.]|nr:SIR2 family protein [Nitrospira sp.]MDE0485881.1 SIR2 family protein [Nitrospira sp.]
MPAFITDGPDIPEHLLQAHEDGHVVFFCGAGISVPAGLPRFKGLVDGIYQQLGTNMEPVEKEAYEKGHYDATIHQLERRYPGQRPVVRKTLASVLKPELDGEGATTTHWALLQLAKDRYGISRLVTTNFDRIFQHVIAQEELKIDSFEAPYLPIPKPSRWNGIVHLHGLLPTQPDEAALNRLVLSSGDFGLAYLTERWAARFVSALFQHHIVCFVGYRVNDPVLRYMMDALAADELLGEKKSEAYAFASFTTGQKERTSAEWKAKGISPLTYEVPANGENHSALHRTLKEWADTYRDGVQGKKMIITQHASTPPLTSSRSDFAVGRVLWALTDDLAAQHFAEMNPVPPLEWLDPLGKHQFEHRDLSCFGVVATNDEDEKLRFSVLNRPAPYTLSLRMGLVYLGARRSGWDKIMSHLARWLTRHLDDPKLIIWLAERGGQLDEQFARLIRSRIEELDTKSDDELDRIRANAPKAIPGRLMRTLWRLLLAGRLRSPTHRYSLYETQWLDRIARDGITPSLRTELREILAPCVTLREPFHWGEDDLDSSEPSRIEDLVEWELVLASDHVHAALLSKSERRERWQEGLPDLLPDFTVLLRDALDLKRELGAADERTDLSYMQHPSISDHTQNSDFRDWTALIKLTRDAWLATAQIDHARARQAAEGWWQIRFPVFKRLALFAAAQPEVISQQQALDWLLAEDSWWLWSTGTQRESLRLLVTLASKLDPSERDKLERAILNGPPSEMFPNDLEQEKRAGIVDRYVWLRLEKIQSAGAALGQAARTKLDELTQQHPIWRMPEDESDEFPAWMEVNDGADRREFLPTPQRRRELVEWLREHHGPANHWRQDGWLQRCRNYFPTSAWALRVLARQNEWPEGRWQEALRAWSEGEHIKRSWRYIGPVLNDASDEFVHSLGHVLGWWLQAIATNIEGHEEFFLNLCRRILRMDHPDEENFDSLLMDNALFRAMSHTVGLVTEALLRWWHRSAPEEGQELPGTLKLIFTELCNTDIEKYRHGRVVLAAHVVSLYQVDRDWTMEYLVPLFDWQHLEVEAFSVWAGFLRSPRLYGPLLSVIKEPILETANHYEKFGSEHAQQYADFLTFAALDPGGIFTIEELATATKNLPQPGLKNVARTLTRALEGAGDQRVEYWQNRVLPFFSQIWPQDEARATTQISEDLGRLCVAAGDAFPEALDILCHWLKPGNPPTLIFLVRRLREAEICQRFPERALTFLEAIVGPEAEWVPEELRQCLNDIRQEDQQLATAERFRRLEELIERQGLV